ncbi:F-box family protein [Rhynchospora pubera]|uniref:F-box family protein n=1 Tax=Rhynchospora pubera TaxID=906938 RepID=A0AAV8FQV8_9POAL|nr:F-box family protein [Rhynchospora pubera]
MDDLPMSIAGWSELHDDVLEHLTSFLSLPDFHRFGAVCRNWHSVARQKRHPPRQLPWLVLGEDDATHKSKFFSLEENKTYLIEIPELQGQRLCGSSYGWLFTLDIELNFRLLNPLTRKQYDLPPLPPYNSHNNITTYVKGPRSENYFTFEAMQLSLVAKAILDHDPSRSSDFKVLIMYGERNRLAFWKLGDPTWTLIPDAYIRFNDIIFYKEDFYAVGCCSRYNEIYLVNTGLSPYAKRVGPLVKEYDTFTYLVDYLGELLIVQRYRKVYKGQLYKTEKIIIFKIDLEHERYSEYKPTEGYSVFMGANSCMTVDPSKYPGCKKNALYLTDLPQQVFERHGSKDLLIYDMVEGSFSRYYSTAHYLPASPIWLDPNY